MSAKARRLHGHTYAASSRSRVTTGNKLARRTREKGTDVRKFSRLSFKITCSNQAHGNGQARLKQARWSVHIHIRDNKKSCQHNAHAPWLSACLLATVGLSYSAALPRCEELGQLGRCILTTTKYIMQHIPGAVLERFHQHLDQ